MKFVTIDGIDKSGKSTLINKLYARTNGLVYIMDRSLSSWHAFNHMMKRVDNNRLYEKEYKQKLKSFRQLVDLAIMLDVNEKDWKDRCLEHKEQPLVGLPFDQHKREIGRWFNKAAYKNVLHLNTSELTSDKCIDIILHRLNIYK